MIKGQGHQTALLSAALTREAGAAVTARTYWAWELLLYTLRLKLTYLTLPITADKSNLSAVESSSSVSK